MGPRPARGRLPVDDPRIRGDQRGEIGMCCEKIEKELGCYVDGELTETRRSAVEAHLESCSKCRAEVGELRELAIGIAGTVPPVAPDAVWEGIERRLGQPADPAAQSGRSARSLRLRGVPWAIAAVVVLAVGLGWFGLSSSDTSAQASTVDFGVLLEALPLDANKAFQRFLVRYGGKPTTPIAAKRIAPDLDFDTPPELPGGFKLRSVFQLRIGNATGIAASYDRDGEFLAVVFHPPMKHEKFGTHQDYPCVIGKHCGHKVQVGDWKLVHLTDATTCHCLLSKLDEKSEMPEVMSAIAPNSRNRFEH